MPSRRLWVPSRHGLAALVAFALAAQTALLTAGLSGWVSGQGVVLGVLATSLVMACAGAVGLRGASTTPSFTLFVISVAALGPFGLLGWGLTETVRRLSARWGPPALADGVSLTAPKNQEPRSLYQLLLLRGVTSARNSTVSPFAEVIEFGSFEQKQSVVTLIADHFRPEFASALRAALNNPEPAIRVQAATAVARIENQFLQRSVALEGARVEHPTTRPCCARSPSITKRTRNSAFSTRRGYPLSAEMRWPSTSGCLKPIRMTVNWLQWLRDFISNSTPPTMQFLCWRERSSSERCRNTSRVHSARRSTGPAGSTFFVNSRARPTRRCCRPPMRTFPPPCNTGRVRKT